MEMFSQILDGMAICQGIILGILLVFLKKNNGVSRYLGFFLITYVLEFIPTTIEQYQDGGITHWQFLPLYFYFLNVPLLYLYCRKLIGEISIRHLLGVLIPAGIEFVTFLGIFGLLFFNQVSVRYSTYLELFLDIYSLAALVYSIVYAILSLRLMISYRTKAVNFYSRLDGKIMNWVMVMLWFILGFYVVYGIIFFLSFWMSSVLDGFFNIMSLINVFFVYYVALSGYNQSLQNVMVLTQYKEQPQETEVDLSDFFVRLVDYFNRDKPHMNPDLNIQLLAVEMNVNYKKISKAINENASENFNTFVNKFRVEEAKQMLHDPRYSQFSILAIGYEAGFNSKASFYSAFKRFTNSTPLQFKTGK
ncbi:AraC family transcriptional regulator [Marinilabiliaceae bacterium JC017]|nr:AraC family transcriptional regulator [Marinilabiliaceae bacterium JC017]